jgi:C terminal of Calcineurin-like phosphoesterase/Calcineurin-like phosphoesterase
MLGAGATLLSPHAVSVADARISATGVVFDDRNGDGIRRSGGGIPNILVSNGRDVVATDDEGRWNLPVADGDHLFVVKPSHWTTPHGPGGVPRSSHLHQPLGSPDNSERHFPGVRPTGSLPASIDFPLRRTQENSRFDALLLTDSQPQDATELQYFRDDILAGAIAANCAFGINHGDVMFDDLSLYDRYLRILDATQIPWHHCPGNHDINFEARSDRFSRETWKRVFGPRHYAFQHGGATFIVLDNVYYMGRNPGSAPSGHYRGMIGGDQLRFVGNVLAHVAQDALIVVSMHIPLVSSQTPADPAHTTADYGALMALLSGRPHTLSFAGHMHTTEHHYLGAGKGFHGPGLHHHHILTAASGSWWSGPKNRHGVPMADSVDGTPNGFHVLSVDDNRYTTRFVAAAEKAAGQMRIAINNTARGQDRDASRAATLPMDALSHCEIVVNVFDGGPRTGVTCEIAGRRAGSVTLQRAAMPDPLTVRLFADHAAACKSWVRAVESTHIWKAPVPDTLEPGTYRITARARDEYGRVHTAHAVLEVVAQDA